MAFRRLVHDGDELTTTAQLLLTFSDKLTAGGAVLQGITLNNLTSSDQTATLHLVKTGDSPAESNVIADYKLIAHEHITLRGPWYADSLAEVWGINDNNDAVSVRVTAVEQFQEGGL